MAPASSGWDMCVVSLIPREMWVWVVPGAGAERAWAGVGSLVAYWMPASLPASWSFLGVCFGFHHPLKTPSPLNCRRKVQPPPAGASRAPVPGWAQMEGLWAGAMGQNQPPLASAALLSPHCLPVSPAHPFPGRPSVISTRLPWAPEGAPVGFPALGVSRKVGAAGWRGRGGGVRVDESRPTELLFNTHFSDELSVKPLIN